MWTSEPKGKLDVMTAMTRRAGQPQGVLAHLTTLHTPEKVTIRTQVTPADLGAGVEAAVLERILSPLLENALRHAMRAITITAERGDGAVAICVTDDGPGMPPDMHEQIFAPGVRLSTNDRPDGAGLGLALARRLARAADGNVTVMSPSAPCTFRVDLPPA